MFNNGYDNNSNSSQKKKDSHSHEPAEKTASNSFRKLLKNFASDTSFGGISKATLSDGHFRRIAWLLISATCYGFTIYMCYLLVNTYMDKPIKTAVDIVYEKNIDFPSVTICNLNQFRKKKIRELRAIFEILENYSDDRRNKSDGSSFESSVNKQGRALKKDFGSDSDADQQDLDDIDVDEDILIEQLVAIKASYYSESELKKAGHQKGDTILSCSWKGLDCRDGYFAKYWAQTWNWKYGNCFTFNPGGNETGHHLNVFRTSKPGPNYGLSLDLNIEQEEYVDELTDEAGAIIVIHNARQMPFPYDEGITVPPGFSSSIAIRKESITRVDPFNNGSCNPSPSLARDNIFRLYMNGASMKYSTKVTFSVYKNYIPTKYKVELGHWKMKAKLSLKNSLIPSKGYLHETNKACMESCLATAQRIECNCSDAKFAGYIDLVCESEEELECMSEVNNKFKDNRLGCTGRCSQPCEHHSFRYTVMTSTLTSKEKETKKKKDFGDRNGSDFDFDGNFLRVKVFYDELNLQKIVQATYYDLQTLLGDIGGQLGLWIGICVISVAEFGELLISLCVVAVRKTRDRKKTKASEIELT